MKNKEQKGKNDGLVADWFSSLGFDTGLTIKCVSLKVYRAAADVLLHGIFRSFWNTVCFGFHLCNSCCRVDHELTPHVALFSDQDSNVKLH